MLTVSQVAKKARVAPNTVRYHVRDFPDLFSEAARGLHGNRLFNDEDVAAFCSLVALKNSGMSLVDAADRLRSQQAPPVIDVAAMPLQDPASTLQGKKTALETPQTLPLVITSMQTQIDALWNDFRALQHERATERRNDKLQGALWGGILMLGVVALALWLLYLLATIY